MVQPCRAARRALLIYVEAFWRSSAPSILLSRQTQPRRICSPLGTGLLNTHIRFTYTNAGQYLINIGWIYPEGYGKNSTAFSTLGSAATAEFVVGNERVVGFGWNDISDDVRREGPVEGRHLTFGGKA